MECQMPTAYMWHQHHIVELAARGGQLMTRDGLSQQVPGISTGIHSKKHSSCVSQEQQQLVW